MSRIVLGKYVNTHGIKGEIRIKSDFKYKSRVFKVGNTVIIDNKEYIINSYRVHKDYDMISLKDIDDINKIPFNKNILVYINKEDYLNGDDYLDSDLIGFTVYNSKIEKKVIDISYLKGNKKLLKTMNGYIPFELIKNIDFKNKKILVEEVLGL